MSKKRSYFSVRYDLVQVGIPIEYDLFVNSSTIKEKEKFVRIFPVGGILNTNDLEDFHRKYFQLYVPEDQRKNYLRSLVKSNLNDVKKRA